MRRLTRAGASVACPACSLKDRHIPLVQVAACVRADDDLVPPIAGFMHCFLPLAEEVGFVRGCVLINSSARNMCVCVRECRSVQSQSIFLLWSHQSGIKAHSKHSV